MLASRIYEYLSLCLCLSLSFLTLFVYLSVCLSVSLSIDRSRPATILAECPDFHRLDALVYLPGRDVIT